MKIVIPPKLNQETYENVIPHISHYEAETVVIDLSNMSFIEPYGLVGLVSLIRLLREQGAEIEVDPAGWSAESYLKRMGFYSAITEYAPFLGPARSISMPSRTRPLLEVTKVDVTNGIDEFMQTGTLLYERMEMMLSGNTSYSASIINSLITSIIEVCQNIEHSKSFGYVAAQKYARWNNAVKVGVMDLGIGISESLKPKYGRGQKWSDRKAISLAIQPQYTARTSGIGGMGLVKVRDFILGHLGCDFALRSGTAKYTISDKGEEKFHGGLHYFPGTQVSMTIRPSS